MAVLPLCRSCVTLALLFLMFKSSHHAYMPRIVYSLLNVILVDEKMPCSTKYFIWYWYVKLISLRSSHETTANLNLLPLFLVNLAHVHTTCSLSGHIAGIVGQLKYKKSK